MKDCEKLFVVIYLNVGEIAREDSYEYISEAAKAFRLDDSVYRLIIPVRERETNIEFYSMKDLDPATEEKIKELDTEFNNFIENYGKKV